MKKTIAFGVLFTILLNSVTASNTVEARQLFFASKAKLALKNVHLILDLKTFDGRGNSKAKSLDIAFAEFNKEKKILIKITAPDNVKGTKILTTDSPDKKGIVEIYMPATGKIQKIRASKRNLRIMGSEIPLAQFSNVVEAGFKFSLLGKDDLNGTLCYKIKLESPDAGEYGIAFVSVKDENLLRLEQYDSRQVMITLTKFSEYAEVSNTSGKYYPRFISVKNLKTGECSDMKILRASYITDISIDDFSLANAGS
jgi:hypothetical protein